MMHNLPRVFVSCSWFYSSKLEPFISKYMHRDMLRQHSGEKYLKPYTSCFYWDTRKNYATFGRDLSSIQKFISGRYAPTSRDGSPGGSLLDYDVWILPIHNFQLKHWTTIAVFVREKFLVHVDPLNMVMNWRIVAATTRAFVKLVTDYFPVTDIKIYPPTDSANIISTTKTKTTTTTTH